MAVLPGDPPRDWLLFVLAVAITSALGALVTHCQRTVDEVAQVFYAAGRRDALREINSHRPGVVKLSRQRMDA